MTKKATSRQLRRKDWLEAGQLSLRADGIRALRLHPLAKSLGVSTGSFYHHFDSFDEYLGALSEYYCGEQYRENMEQVLYGTMPARQRIERTTRLTRENGWDLTGLAMRAWAKSDERAARAVHIVDAALSQFFAECFMEAGLPREEAFLRSYIMLALGTTDLKPPAESGSRAAFNQRLLQLLCPVD